MDARYERERDLVELLMRRRGLTAESYIDPNKEAREETGLDVIAIVGGRRIGMQVTELDTGTVRGQSRHLKKLLGANHRSAGMTPMGPGRKMIRPSS